MRKPSKLSKYYPIYRFDPSSVFPELGPGTQSTLDTKVIASGLVISAAVLAGGGKFVGLCESLTVAQVSEEIERSCREYNINIEWLLKWAESILTPPEEPGFLDVVPTRIFSKNFNLHLYQRQMAAWAAWRMGSVAALGCGVGKTATAIAAAAAAVKNGRCNSERCYIVCPLNAMPTWEGYLPDIEKYFEEVRILSRDSIHKHKFLERLGGALILDEVHGLKNLGAYRTGEAHELRLGFEWAICLTGTLLHTGAEGVMSVLDLACPGLSRFTDKWKFGEQFKCIKKNTFETKRGKKTKHDLGIPSIEVRDKFAKYLVRGVWSRSNASEDVRESFQIPGQNKTIITSWEKPDWLISLENKFVANFRLTALENGNPDLGFTDEEILMTSSPYLWPPDYDWKDLMAAAAVALMHQEKEAWQELLKLEGPAVAGPEPGLPAFSTLMHFISKLGRHDLVIERFFDKEGKPCDYHFLYAPGSSALEPAPGPKPKWVMQWIAEHPDEPVVVGAQGVQTIDALQELLKAEKIEYRLIRGGVPTKDRKEFIADFQDGKYQVMLLQQVAGSESVTLTNAATSILMDHNWSPIPYTQFMARTCRQGQTQECDHYDLSFNTLQKEIIQRLIRGEAFDAEARAKIESIYSGMVKE